MGKERFEDRAYEFWLSKIKRLSPGKKCMLHQRMKSAKNIYYIEETGIAQLTFLTEKEKNTILQARKEQGFQKEFEQMAQQGIRFVTYYDREYPSSLLEVPEFPFALFVKGSLPDEGKRKAAIIGARKCTRYGESHALEYGEQLARAGVEIVSGMARGVDGMGHRGALNGGGRTYAVLGCGADLCYPKEHIGLYMDLLSQGGGVLSELPPGTPPLPMHFPARNRIISGLADAVLVMEARVKSGSLITADCALEQGKDVYALPGPVDSPLSYGCNRLIWQGAGILLSPGELLKAWGIEERAKDVHFAENKKVLERTEKLVYSCLGLYPKSTDQLEKESGVEMKELLGTLVMLELCGYAKKISNHYYIKAD